jgi:hypothetical protein
MNCEHLFSCDQLLDCRDRLRGVTTIIFIDHLDLAAVYSSGCVDMIVNGYRAVVDWVAPQTNRPGQGPEHPNLDLVRRDAWFGRPAGRASDTEYQADRR